MKICAHTMSPPTFDPFQAAQVYASIGFDGMELICVANYKCAIEPTVGDAGGFSG
jgi:hypothetical protein